MNDERSTPKTLSQEFSDASAVHLAGDAPKDGNWFVAKDRHGELALVRWRSGADLDQEGDPPYFARFDTDEPFEIVAWVPSSCTYDDLVKTYG